MKTKPSILFIFLCLLSQTQNFIFAKNITENQKDLKQKSIQKTKDSQLSNNKKITRNKVFKKPKFSVAVSEVWVIKK